MAVVYRTPTPEQQQADPYRGRPFDRLTVIGLAGWTKNGLRLYRVRCRCGNEPVVYKCALDRGHSRSCGCLARENTAARSAEDITDQRFGRLVAKRPAYRTAHGIVWWCRCDCGRMHRASVARLKVGDVESCGCLARDLTSARSTTHGHTANRKLTREYACWLGMKERCRPDFHAHVDYADKGIAVCAEWVDDFPAFLAHIGPAPSPQHTIDRLENHLGYEPGNVRWATRAEQARNKGDNVVIVAGGRAMCRSEWAREFGLLPGYLCNAHRAGRLAEVFARFGLTVEWCGKRKDMPRQGATL